MSQFQLGKNIAAYSLVTLLSAWSPTLFAATMSAPKTNVVPVSMMMDGTGPGMMGSTNGMSTQNSSQNESQDETPALGAKLVHRFCIQCHALPDPRQHTAQEWPYVVARMNNYMHYRYMPAPDQQQMNEIIEFLAKYARY
jgi:hypothetical protein